jgi:hypothetical protein
MEEESAVNDTPSSVRKTALSPSSDSNNAFIVCPVFQFTSGRRALLAAFCAPGSTFWDIDTLKEVKFILSPFVIQ